VVRRLLAEVAADIAVDLSILIPLGQGPNHLRLEEEAAAVLALEVVDTTMRTADTAFVVAVLVAMVAAVDREVPEATVNGYGVKKCTY